VSRDTLTDGQIAEARELYDSGKTLGEVAEHFSRSIYDFSPWLYMEHPSVRDAIAAAEKRAGIAP
jgi:hypothetical protein